MRIPCNHRLTAVLVDKVHKCIADICHGPFVKWDVQEVEFTSRTSFLHKSHNPLLGSDLLAMGLACKAQIFKLSNKVTLGISVWNIADPWSLRAAEFEG